VTHDRQHRAPAPEVPEAPASDAPDEVLPDDDGALAGEVVPEEDPLERVSAERDQYLDALQRMKAEFDNYRKRSERERQATAAGAAREVVRGLLPVMDNLERAVAALGSQGEGIVAGLEMVRGQLAGVLTEHGVEEIAAHGEAFDPTVHEAIAQIPSSDHPEGTVIEVIQKGYRQSEHVLRPTRVVVAKPPAGSA
jgi:molecular chaperone GrpE